MHKLLIDTPGEEILLLGNEAIARGLWKQGYPLPHAIRERLPPRFRENFFKISQETDLYFEYSTNEKVALEVGAGAAVAGLRTMVTMKHVGMNVASDPMMTLA